DGGEALKLLEAGVEKMAGVVGSELERSVPIIDFLRARATGDPVIFDAGEAAMVGRWQIRLHVVEVEVEADITVKITIARVAGIPFVPAPDLSGRLQVAPKRRDAVGREDRGEHAITRT